MKDDNGDVVKLSVNFGYAGDFVELDGNNIVIKDLSALKPGSYLFALILNDGRDSVNYPLSLIIVDNSESKKPVMQFNQKEEEEEVKEDPMAAQMKALQDKIDQLRAEREARLAALGYIPEPPNPYFKDVLSSGQVVIGFTQDIQVVANLTMINNGTIFMDELDMYYDHRILRSHDENRDRIPVLTVEVLPGFESSAEDLTFRWNVTAEDKRTMYIQLYFDKPLVVSSNVVSLLLSFIFIDS